MSNEDETREDFKFRFLDLQEPFWKHVKEVDQTPSKVIRHFLRQGLSPNSGLTIEQQTELKKDVINLKRGQSAIGNNLNQIARYFHQNGHLIESDLYRQLQATQQYQKDITKLFNELLKKL